MTATGKRRHFVADQCHSPPGLAPRVLGTVDETREIPGIQILEAMNLLPHLRHLGQRLKKTAQQLVVEVVAV